MPKVKHDILEITRHAVGGINLDDLKKFDEKISTSERLDYLRKSELVFSNFSFQNEIKNMMQEQKDFIAMTAITMDEVSFGRGMMNALCLMQERFESLHNEYKSRTKEPNKNFDKFNVLPE